MVRLIPAFLTALGTICVFTASGHAAAADFYSGKTIRIVVGFSPGGFDAYSRSLSRHMRKHLPGNPNITVENMPGAGSLIAANYLYKAASPDGLTIGNFIGSVLMGPDLGTKGHRVRCAQIRICGGAGKILSRVFVQQGERDCQFGKLDGS